MRVRDLLDVPGLGLRLLTDVTGMDRPIRHVYTTDLPDPGRYLTKGDLVLTGMIWCREPGDADRFVKALARAGANVLGAGEALRSVPAEVIDACGRHGVALLAVPPETSFATVIDEVGRRLSGDRATAMTRVLGRRRLLLSAVAEGAGLDEMFRLMGREIGMECWLLTAAGRVVGGTSAALPRPLALRLSTEYLKADRLPVVTKGLPAADRSARDDDRRYSLFGVGSEPRITSWFLACAGREQDWPHELRESIAELVADIALERARLDAGRAGDRKLAEAIVGRLAADGGAASVSAPLSLAAAAAPASSPSSSVTPSSSVSPAEIASLMGAAGLAPDGRYLVAALRVEGPQAGAGSRLGLGGLAAGRWRCDLAEELILRPAAEQACPPPAGPAFPPAGRVLLAPLGDEIIVLVPLSGPCDPDEAPPAHAFAARLREARPVLEADRSRLRLGAGISAPAEGVAALPGALHEARSARRLAALRGGAPDPVRVVTSDEVASHELLLASVPGSVLRSFRERLLGPLLAYDEQHRAELMPTLREFLACSGSWNACAAKMYVHVNTVRYRIRRIEELTGRDLSSLDDRVDFFLALRIR